LARILIVDDSLLIRTLLREILQEGGHEIVAEAKDGIEAMARAQQLKPDVMILDLMMPRRDGLTTLQQLQIVNPGLPVIVCSAWLTERRVIDALRLGVRGFIAKPFDRATVLGSVGQALEGKFRTRPQAPAPGRDVRPEERREFARVEARLRVVIVSEGGQELATVTVNVGGGGMLLETTALEPGAAVEFRLMLEAGEEPIVGRGRVVRESSEANQAVAFEEVSVADHERLIHYIESRHA
jgi:two-component system chemotaxis response regulator CheY